MSQHYYPDPPRPTNSLAMISFILGVTSYFAIPVIGAIGAVITGHLANSEMKASPERYSGKVFANTGLILGYTQLVFTLVAVIMIIIAVLMIPAVTIWLSKFIQ